MDSKKKPILLLIILIISIICLNIVFYIDDAHKNSNIRQEEYNNMIHWKEYYSSYISFYYPNNYDLLEGENGEIIICEYDNVERPFLVIEKINILEKEYIDNESEYIQREIKLVENHNYVTDDIYEKVDVNGYPSILQKYKEEMNGMVYVKVEYVIVVEYTRYIFKFKVMEDEFNEEENIQILMNTVQFFEP